MVMNGGISVITKLQTTHLGRQQGRRSASTRTDTKAPNEDSWRHSIGNISTVICLQLLVHLTTHYFDGSQLAVIFMSSLLVLLHSEQAPVDQLSAKNRFYPMILYNSIHMVVSALTTVLLSRPFFNYTGYFHVQPSINYTTRVAWKNLLLAVGTFPGTILANLFLHSWKQQNALPWLLVIPLNILALLLADITQLRMLALFSIVTSIYQFVHARNNHNRSTKTI